MLQRYFKNLYDRTMREAYNLAMQEIYSSLTNRGNVLDCGANKGYMFNRLAEHTGLDKSHYFGLEWNQQMVDEAVKQNINVVQADLNQPIPHADKQFQCVFGLSVVEHLLNPCLYLRECYRVLDDGGRLIVLTPNISTYFTAVLILLGKMPSSGPHPDSEQLLQQEELYNVRIGDDQPDIESDTPVHRHLVVFSYRVLMSYMRLLGFKKVEGHGFGLYPFPNFMQPVLEKIDPWHCHQMVIIAEK